MSDDLVTVTLVPQYPANPADLREVYASNAIVNATTEDVYLDFAQAQPQWLNREGGSVTVPMLVRVRVILTREHAKRLGASLQALLTDATAPPEVKS